MEAHYSKFLYESFKFVHDFDGNHLKCRINYNRKNIDKIERKKILKMKNESEMNEITRNIIIKESKCNKLTKPFINNVSDEMASENTLHMNQSEMSGHNNVDKQKYKNENFKEFKYTENTKQNLS